MNRNDIKDIYKWDLTTIYQTETEFNQDLEALKQKMSTFTKYEKVFTKDAKHLYDTLTAYFDISRNLEKLYTYAHLLYDEDTSDNHTQSMKLEAENLYDDWNQKTYFLTPSLLKKDYSQIEKFYQDYPPLKEYEIFLKREFRYQEHTLSDKEEKLIAGLNPILNNNYQTYELLKDSDLTFGTITDEEGNSVELTSSNYTIYIESKNRTVRQDAFQTLYKTYKQFINTFASTLSGMVKENSTLAKFRRFNSTLEWCLYADELPRAIYDNLINTVNKGLDVLYEYYDLKKDVLKLDNLHLYDIYTPIVPRFEKKYPFDTAKETVLNALSVLGDDYVNTLKEGYDARWIDVYPTNSKRTGGYSSGSYDTYPYILLNYQDKYDDMSTLAHESGHSMHSYYARTSNPYQYGDYSIFVAEVASTVNELLLAKYLLKNSTDTGEKLFILDNLMNLFKGTIYRQTMFAEFERDIYTASEHGTPLTADYLNKEYYKLNQKYFSPDMIIDDEIKYEWARIPHFYYTFYVYKYATGLSAATCIVNNILSGKENAVTKYKEFLKCGTTKNPLESLAIAGVDLTNPEVITSAIEMFANTIKEFKELSKAK